MTESDSPAQLVVALCQINTIVGDLGENVERILAAWTDAAAAGADVALFPELAITGYPPEDLLLKPGFVEDSAAALKTLAAHDLGACVAVVGWVQGSRRHGADPHNALDGPWNSAAVLHGGRLVASYRKQALPNYAVFDEKRYFDPGPAGQPLLRIAGITVAVTICEDVWLSGGPSVQAARAGAQVILNINASPFHPGKQDHRTATLSERVREIPVPIAYVNQVGGQDELVFDGGSMVMGTAGIEARAPRFVESTVMVPVTVARATPITREVVEVTGARRAASSFGAAGTGVSTVLAPSPEGPEEIWEALCLGTTDYLRKNGFSEAVLGLSGGVDSALVAAIATDALGADNVHAVLMPSRYSSDHSVTDAQLLADRLGIEHRTIEIEPAHHALMAMLEPSFSGHPPGLTEENLQSRIRGVLLMALSNEFGWLVLTTGNKSETAVGYSTLYGDSAGGLAVIKDVPKLLVYELCRWRNDQADGERIPESILTKAPSAELRPDQRDDQSLPAYEVLDPLIADYVDGDMTAEQLVAAGHETGLVARITRLVDLAEYKRRQSPPGIRVSQKAFGRDRRLPITNGYLPDNGYARSTP